MPTTKRTTTKKKVAKKVAKKATKKKVAKKATKKTAKKVSKKTAKRNGKSLVYASNDTSFWVSDGQILNSLVALRDALDEMEKEVYEYHAKANAQNDFANWVAAVLCDGDCAQALEKAKTSKSAKTVVVKHLKSYSV